jgi:hypothetical protein
MNIQSTKGQFIVKAGALGIEGTAAGPPEKVDADFQSLAQCVQVPGEGNVIGVPPGSLADQYHNESDGRDPISFFYPYGYLY